jgi:hypothetical protein
MNKRGFRANDKVRECVRIMWMLYNDALAKHTDREGISLPPELTHKGLPIRKSSLVCRMCKWVYENPFYNERAGMPECLMLWLRVIKRVKTTNILRNGYGKLTDPSLYWLFAGEWGSRGIDKVLEGKYDNCLAPQYRQLKASNRRKAKMKRKIAQLQAKLLSGGEQSGQATQSCESAEANSEAAPAA